VPISELQTASDSAISSMTALEEAERDHILRALQEAKWVVGGDSGAAARLGVKRTTLQSKMQKFGITRPE
jgi:formate hydrogenlyase transcriptional activator